MKDIECPYCGEDQEVCHDDGFGYDENVKHEMECVSCEKSFVFTTSIIFCYESEKADCLNGRDHDYKETHTFPRRYTRLECTMCGHEKPLPKDHPYLNEPKIVI